VDLTGLVVTATATEAANGDTASISDTMDVQVDAVIDTPFLNVADISASEDTPADLNITTGSGETADGSEQITGVVISGVPAGFSLSAGTEVSPGVWQLTQAELAGLKQIGWARGVT